MAKFKGVKLSLIGETPLLLHNGQLADPLNEWAKRIKVVAGKRKKTDADHQELARLEWFGSLYTENGKIVIPGEVVEATIVSGAKKQRRGEQAKRGVVCIGNFPLRNGGADLGNLDKLWESGKYHLRSLVSVGQATVCRTRPKFDEWAVDVEVKYDPNVLEERDVISALEDEGAMCDWRPKFGRFRVEKQK